jgi:hypothetical protein
MKTILLLNKSFLSKMAVSVALSLLICSTASAAQIFGRITAFDINGGIPGRNVCVQMLPFVPASNGNWACLYNSNLLKNEISTMLREAYLQKKSCWVAWNTFDGTTPKINNIQCL